MANTVGAAAAPTVVRSGAAETDERHAGFMVELARALSADQRDASNGVRQPSRPPLEQQTVQRGQQRAGHSPFGHDGLSSLGQQ